MAIKAINNSAGPNGLVPTLLVFGTYSQLTEIDPLSPLVIKRAEAIRAITKEVVVFTQRDRSRTHLLCTMALILVLL